MLYFPDIYGKFNYLCSYGEFNDYLESEILAYGMSTLHDFCFKWFILSRTGLTDGSCGIRTHDSWILEAWPLLTAPSVRTRHYMINIQ